MDSDPERFVPKVHPATRAVEPDDPMDLDATLVPGDVDLMFRSVVQEYAWMGWGDRADPRAVPRPVLSGASRPLAGLGRGRDPRADRGRAGPDRGHPFPRHGPRDGARRERPRARPGTDRHPGGPSGPCGTAPGSFVGIEALNGGTTRREGDSHVEGL